MPLLQRALTKQKEVRDFHMEKAINSSMPRGQSEEDGEGEGLAGDIRKRRRCEGEQELKLNFLRTSSSGPMSKRKSVRI